MRPKGWAAGAKALTRGALAVLAIFAGTAIQAAPAPPPATAATILSPKPTPPPNDAKYYPGGNMSLPPTSVYMGALGYHAAMNIEDQLAKARALALIRSQATNAPALDLSGLKPSVVTVEVLSFGEPAPAPQGPPAKPAVSAP